MGKAGRFGKQGVKHKITKSIPVGCQLPCSDNTGAKLLNIMAVYENANTLNQLPTGSIGDILLASVRKGKPELRKKKFPVVIIRQRKHWRRSDGITIYCEDNAGVIITIKGETKGSAVLGPVAKECAELFPKIASSASAVL